MSKIFRFEPFRSVYFFIKKFVQRNFYFLRNFRIFHVRFVSDRFFSRNYKTTTWFCPIPVVVYKFKRVHDRSPCLENLSLVGLCTPITFRFKYRDHLANASVCISIFMPASMLQMSVNPFFVKR